MKNNRSNIKTQGTTMKQSSNNNKVGAAKHEEQQ